MHARFGIRTPTPVNAAGMREETHGLAAAAVADVIA
jgi:hypothetical protein